MTKPHALAAVVLLVAVSLLAAARAHASGAGTRDNRLARLEAAARAHPEDADLALLLAREQAAHGRPDEAIAVLERCLAHGASRLAAVHGELGRLRFAAGEAAPARAHFAAALAAEPDSGALRFQHALALRALGRREEAAFELGAAQQRAPELEPDVLLVRALDLLAEGETERAEPLLLRILEIDPTGEAARRARLILFDRVPRALPRWYRLDAYGGVEYDSNVTLDSESDVLPSATGRSDGRGVFGAGLVLRPLRGARGSLTAGFRYDQGVQFELSRFDFVNNAGWLTGVLRVGGPLALRLDTVAFNTRLDGESYATVASLAPSLLVDGGDRFGTTRLYAEVEWRRYQETPATPYFERDAEAFGAGIEQFHALFGADSFGSLGFRYERTDTHAPITGQFGGDYDRDLYEGMLRVHQPLGDVVDADGWLAVGFEDYRYTSFFAFAQSFALVEREDTLIQGRFALSRGLGRFVRVEVAYLATDRRSNIDAFDYVRHVVGVYVRASTE